MTELKSEQEPSSKEWKLLGWRLFGTVILLIVLSFLALQTLTPKKADASTLQTEVGYTSYGSVGESVVAIQKELLDKGYYNYEVDGSYGPITVEAVTKYQEDNGLQVDGMAGPETIGSLDTVKVRTKKVQAVAPKQETKELTQNQVQPQPQPQAQEPAPAPVQAPVQEPVQEASSSGKVLTVNASAYTARCTGCSGITAGGTNVLNTNYHPSGYPIIATDPNVIPLGTLVKINGTTYISDDKGGAIKGNKIDILMSTKEEAYSFGRRDITIEVLY